MLETWKRFVEGLPPEAGMGGFILESWERCRGFAVDVAKVNLCRLPYGELRQRVDANRALLDAATPHLRWALAGMTPVNPVVIMLTDADGVILESVGNAPEVMTAFGLIPGYDWSERSMGTNGIGTALAHGEPVAVVGSEHYKQAWHNNTCVGAPVWGVDGKIVGAVDICTMVADGDPARLILVSFLAHVVGRELGVASGAAFASPAVLQRAAATGSSASGAVLAHHALDLQQLEQALLEGARPAQPRVDQPLDEVRLDPLLERVVARFPLVELITPRAPTLTSWGPARRYELALVQLLTLTLRRAPAGARVSLAAEADELEVLIDGVEGAAHLAVEARPRWRAEVAGLALGEWLAREFVQGLGGSLRCEPGRARYRARFPSSSAKLR